MGRVKLGSNVDTDTLVITKDRPVGPGVMPLDQMQPNPENPRPSDLEVDEMAADLKKRGQLQNINVMTRAAFIEQKPHLTEDITAAFVVINGHRRLAGARQAGLVGLRYEVHDEWTRSQIDEAMVSENVHRLDLNPLALGRQLLRMLPDHGDSHRQLAAALNKQQPWVSQRIGLTNLHPALQDAVEAGTILFKTARECTRLHPDLQPMLASGELPEEVAQAWLVKMRIKPDEQLVRWQAGPPYIGDVPPDPAKAGRADAEHQVSATNGTGESAQDAVAARSASTSDTGESTGPRGGLSGEPVTPTATSESTAVDSVQREPGQSGGPGSPVVSRDVSPAEGRSLASGTDGPGLHGSRPDEIEIDEIEIRIVDRNIAALAGELRDQLTPNEMAELLAALTA